MAGTHTASAPAAAIGNLRPARTPRRMVRVLSQRQQAIVDTLGRATDWVSAAALRDEIAPTTSTKNIHMQVFKIRERHPDAVQIETSSRGYRLVSAGGRA